MRLIFEVAMAVFCAILGAAIAQKLPRSTGRREQISDRGEAKNGGKKSVTASKIIAIGVLVMDATATYIVLYLCYLAITRDYTGALPYLSALIASMQAATGYVLGHYFKKSTAENSKGGITYDSVFGVSADDSDAI